MPRKDGQPTAKERADTERRESNRRYVLQGRDLSDLSDDTLTDVRLEWSHDADVVAVLDAEMERRAHA